MSNMSTSVDTVDLASLMERIRGDAIDYYRLTGKPLGVTGEMAEFEASRVLGLKLCDAREPGCDALRTRPDGLEDRIQIKGRWFPGERKPGARVGRMDMKHPWDTAILVFLDKSYRAAEMWEASRERIAAVLDKPGSKARNERGQMSISQFKAVAEKVWPVDRLGAPK